MKKKKILIAVIAVVVIAIVAVCAVIFSGYQPKVQGDITGEYVECVENEDGTVSEVEDGIIVKVEKKDDVTFVVTSDNATFNNIELKYQKFRYGGVKNGVKFPEATEADGTVVPAHTSYWNQFTVGKDKIGYSTFSDVYADGSSMTKLYMASGGNGSTVFVKK